MANTQSVTPDRRLKVFIAYARADADWAEQLCAFLRDAGFNPIIDRHDTTSGDVWRRRVDALLAAADAVVLVLTNASATSETCASVAEEATRLGKRIIPVLPEELGATPPLRLTESEAIYFYSEPAIPDSGFYDGQKRLEAALKAELGRLQAPAARVEQATRVEARDLPDYRFTRNPADDDEELKRVRAERKKEEKRAKEIARIQRQIMKSRDEWMSGPTPAQAPRRGGLPWLRLALLAAFAGVIYFAATNTSFRAEVRSAWDEALTALGAPAAEEPSDPGARVPAQDYTPDTPIYAGGNGANVRDYPLPSATVLEELPARAALNVTGRLEVQGDWWFRVVLEDGRTGFVHEDAVTRRRPAANAPSNASVQAIEATEAMAGDAGANIRALPGVRAARLVRIEAGEPVTVTGKLRQGGHTWYRVRLEDGREGFARDDVLVTREGQPLRL